MKRLCVLAMLIGCDADPEPAPPPAPIAARIAAPTPELPAPALPLVIDLSNDVIVVEIDCDDPAVHCRGDDDDDIPARVVHDDLVVVVAGDRDRDGVPDAVDTCPDDPEDIDGFEDTDGCPDPDTDSGAMVDVADRCPDLPEDYDGDVDGCPEPARVE